MRVLRDEILAPDMNIRKVAPPAAGDDDLAPNLGVMLDNQHLFPAFAHFNSAKQPGRTAADYDRVVFHLREVPLFEDTRMMPDMSGHYIGKCTHGDGFFAGGADAFCSFVG